MHFVKTIACVFTCSNDIRFNKISLNTFAFYILLASLVIKHIISNEFKSITVTTTLIPHVAYDSDFCKVKI